MDQEEGSKTNQEEERKTNQEEAKTSQDSVSTMTGAQSAAFKRDLAIKERERKEYGPWQAARWKAARQAIADGTYKRPEIRIPVVLDPDGPISTPEQLQRLAGTESLPEVLETTLTTTDRSKEEAVRTVTQTRICHVNYDERERLEERAEVEYDMTGKYAVIFRGRKRYAMIVKSLKEGRGGNGVAGDKGTADDGNGQGNKTVAK